MLLFQRRFHKGLVDGTITFTFRLWSTARVKPGSRYRCHPIGVLEVDAVDRIQIRGISEEDARSSGFSSRAELIAYLTALSPDRLTDESELYRVHLHFAGDGDRVALALETSLPPEEAAQIAERLRMLDASSKAGPWTRRTLLLIEAHPKVAGSKLAKMVGRETAPFKADVVKLKKMGLTQSFEVGYEISPRGRVFLQQVPDREK
jgi:hypothetical protein